MHRRTFLQIVPFAVPLLGADPPKDPWSMSELIEPADLAQRLQKPDGTVHVVCVAFAVLYRQRHIATAVLGGPGNKPEGIEALKAKLKNVAKDDLVVLYCGCCPMEQCPNIRPAYTATKDMGFTKVKVLELTHNFHADWVEKNYPVEQAS